MEDGARHLRGIIDGLLKKIETGPGKKGNAVMDAWRCAADEEIKKHTRPVSFKKGTLVVLVENSGWLYRVTLEKRKILEKFNSEYRGKKKAKDIRFRIGEMEL